MGFSTIISIFIITAAYAYDLEYLRSLTPAEAAQLTIDQFTYGYNAYKQYAWGCDQLSPKSKACHNQYNYSLMWTPIDSLDTMYLMGLTDLLDDTIKLLCDTPFEEFDKFTFKVPQMVNSFDFFLRSLGGLLSGYYFTNNTCLYDLALELSELLYPIFDTESLSGLPWIYINLATGEVDTTRGNTCTAVAGTHTLEYGIMSVLSGDLKYWDASMNVMKILYQARSPTTGLIGYGLYINKTSNIHSPNLFYSTSAHIDGGIDSYYEYILKCWALFNDSTCKNRWINTINSSIIDNLSYYKYDNDSNELLFFKRIDMFDGTNRDDWDQYDLYAPFYSAVLSLSTLIDETDENNKYNLELAKLNQDGNWYMWENNGIYIEPSQFEFTSDNNLAYGYDLNPENFESNYYLYQITNDSIYYDRALIYLYNIIKCCKCNGTDCVGYSGLSNILTKEKSNSLPSYFFAESLKYLYLTFMRNEPNNPLQFNKFVFNTEAHPYPKKWGYKLNDMIKKTYSTYEPTKQNTITPTKLTTKSPTKNPTTKTPTQNPNKQPTTTKTPTKSPIKSPTKTPTKTPTTKTPTQNPIQNPTISPIINPTESPTETPVQSPSINPTLSSETPTFTPSITSINPTIITLTPTRISGSPTDAPIPGDVTCEDIIDWQYRWSRVSSWNEESSGPLYKSVAEEKFIENFPHCGEFNAEDGFEYYYYFYWGGTTRPNRKKLFIYMHVCCGIGRTFGPQYHMPQGFEHANDYRASAAWNRRYNGAGYETEDEWTNPGSFGIKQYIVFAICILLIIVCIGACIFGWKRYKKKRYIIEGANTSTSPRGMQRYPNKSRGSKKNLAQTIQMHGLSSYPGPKHVQLPSYARDSTDGSTDGNNTYQSRFMHNDSTDGSNQGDGGNVSKKSKKSKKKLVPPMFNKMGMHQKMPSRSVDIDTPELGAVVGNIDMDEMNLENDGGNTGDVGLPPPVPESLIDKKVNALDTQDIADAFDADI
eukprot:275920_1